MRLNSYLTVQEAAANATLTTKLQEGLHAVAYALRQIKRKDISFDDLFDPDNFGKAYDAYCKVDTPESELYTFMGKTDWTDSVIESANAAWKSGWLKKKYVYHRNSAFMMSIYDQAQILLAKEKIRMDGNKWNPADIWATTLTSIPKFDTLSAYNEWIAKSLHNSTLIGISLKKLRGKAKVQLVKFNSESEEIGFKGISKPERTYLPTGIRIQTSKAGTDINFRSFSRSKELDITGEIIVKGSAARHGKIPKKLFTHLKNKYGIPQLQKSRIDKQSDTQLIRAVQNLWKQCGYNATDERMAQDWEKRKNDMDNRIGYWQSIIHALELGAFLSTNRGIADHIVDKMMIGASSTSEWSSNHIKVY